MEALTWTGRRAALRCTAARRGLKAFLGTLTTLCLAAAFIVGLGTGSAEARTRVFSGEFSTQSLSQKLETLSESVDTTRSVIFFTFYTQQTTPKYQAWAARFNPSTQSGTSNNQIEFLRNASSTEADQGIKYYVVVSDAFEVESGTASFSVGATSATVNLTHDFPSGKTFSLAYPTNCASNNAGQIIDIQLASQVIYNTAPTQDQIKIWRAGTTNAVDAWYQVVHLRDDSTVQCGLVQATSGDVMVTSTLSTAVDRSKAFLVFSFTTSDGSLDQWWRGSLGSDLTVVFNKRNIGGVSDIYYYCIELGSLGFSQNGSGLLPKVANTYGYADFGFSRSFNSKWRFSVSSLDCFGGGTANDVARSAVKFLNDTTIRAERGDNSQISVMDYFGVQLEPMKVLSPNGGELWKCGEAHDITWYAPARVATVNILLSNDGGGTYPITLASGVTNSGSGSTSYSWTPSAADGAVIGATTRIKVRDSSYASGDDSYYSDTSDANFEVIGKLDLTYPVGGETIAYTDPTNIQWTFYGPTTGRTVALKYSTNSGTSYSTTIATGLAAGSSPYAINWTTGPLPLGDQVRVRVEQVGEESRVYDTSDSNFSVSGEITLSAPTGGQTWKIGESNDVIWTVKGSTFMTNGVDIKLSRNSGGTYTETIAAGIAADSSPFPWTPTAPGTSQARIKVVSIDFPSVGDASGSDFTIQQTLTVTTPSGSGIVWRVGTTHDIEWTTQGTVTTVDILYDKGTGAVTVTPPAGIPNASPYSWPVPDAISDTVKIRVQDHDHTYIYDEGDNNFKIKGLVSVTEPHAGETLHVGTQKTIQWTPTGTFSGDANVRLSKNSGTSYDILLGTVPMSQGYFNWTPVQAHMGVTNKVRVGLDGDEDENGGTGGITGLFAVEGSLVLVYPNATGISHQVGDEVYIKWTPNPAGFGLVNLRYDTNSGKGANGTPGDSDDYQGFIADGVASDNIPSGGADIGYKWTIEDVAGIVGPNVRVKVYQVGKESSVYAASAYDFSIKGSITITGESNGDGTPTWEVGTNHQITWTAVGDISSVDIYYSTTGGEPYNNTIVTDYPAGSGARSYLWQPIPDNVIPNDRNANIKFKVEFSDDATISDVSDNSLIIQGKLVLSQPNGLETLEVDDPDDATDSYQISWDTYGNISQVKLAYDTNSGNDGYDKLIAGGAAIANLDGYSWAVPNAIGSHVRVKVMSANAPSYVSATSAQDFTIKGKIVVTSPDSTNTGTDALRVNSAALPSTHLIEWKNCGDLGTVNIYYSDNGGAEYLPVTSGEAGASGPQSYTWTIPATWGGRNTIGTDNKIKVTQVGNETEVQKESESFAIKGKISMTAPTTSGIYYIGGDPIDVTWNYAGTLGNIEIFFSADGGSAYGAALATIDAGTSQPYALAVPNQPTTQGKLKIEQVSDRTYVNSVTEDPGFAVKGGVILSYPDNNPELSAEVETDLNITWSLTGSIANVAIDYDTNSGNNGYTGAVVGSTSGPAGSYTWTIPNSSAVVSDHVRIRVRDALDITVQDSSVADFKIKPTVTLGSPVGGEGWVVGDLHAITWTTKGFAAGQLVKLQYSDDGGSTWPVGAPYEIVEIDKAALTYNWQIPNSTLSNKCIVRISKVGDSAVSDQSVGWFTIKGKVDVTQPDGGVNLSINTPYTIKWSRTGQVGHVALYYSTDAPHAVWTAITGAEDLDSSIGPTTGFSWTIPDAPSATVKVKVLPIGATDPTDENVSNTDNAIVGSIFLSTPDPDAGDTLVVGTPYDITWTKFGNIAAFDIFVSFNNKTNWTQIGDDVVGLSKTWAPTDNISSQVHFRVVDAGNPDVKVETTAASTLKGSIDLTAPDGANTLTVGTPFDITWTKTGSIGNIKIEYSADNFASDTRTITSSYPSANSPYPWTPGIDDITNADTLKVRVTSIGGIPVSDVSQGAFKVIGGISNVQPSGATTVWVKGQSKEVTWTETGNIGAVDIKYKTASGDSFNKTIVTNDTGHADGANSYPLTVPDENSEDCWVRVYDHANNSVYGTSAEAFAIRPLITVSAPALGANIRVGSNNTNAVQWSRNGSAKVTSVNIAYSTNGVAGPFDKTIASNVDASLGQANWNGVANDVSNTVVVRVADTINTNVYGLSEIFNIVGGITVQAPNGNEDWPVGASRNISWTKTGTVGNVNIYVDYGSGYEISPINPSPIDAETVSVFAWNPIPDEVSNSCKIKIAAVNNPTVVVDESDAVFHIIGGFAFLTPDGSPLTSGDAYDITWTPTGTDVTEVKVEFYNGTSWSTLASNATNSGIYPWTVPSTTAATTCKVRLTASNPVQPATAKESSNFWIHGALSVTAPTSSAKWAVGSQQNILFNVTGKIDTVNIKYSKDGGTDNYAYTVASGYAVSAGANTYQWNIPTDQDILSATGAKLKIVDGAYTTVYGVSQNFMVKGAITVLTPSADNIVMTYGTGNPYAITWSTSGPVSDVRIYYSTNDGTTYPNEITTAAGVPATPASYNWDIPNLIVGKHMKIKVVDKANSEAYGVSDNTFEIIGQISLDAPAGTEKWTVGTNENILWTPTGTYTNVQVQASKDDFATYLLNVTRPAGATGVQQSYQWTNLPDSLTSNLKVRVYDPDHQPTVVRDTSDALSILGGLDVTAPESGQIWYKGETKQITWDASGTVTNVKIEYKTSLAGSYATIEANHGGHTAGANSYDWSVADLNSETCYVRVSDVNNYDDVFSVSVAPFSIRPKITVTAPGLGAVIRVGSNNTNGVQWNIGGSTKVTLVNLLYSTNGVSGPFDKTIANNVDATLGQANWNGVADNVSNNVVVKIVDTVNPNVYGLSEVFSIAGSITVSQPNGGNNWPVGTSQNITWAKTGTVGNVNIYVDYGSGYVVTPLATVDAESVSLWAWNPVPDHVSNTCRIKIADADNESIVFDESDAVFKIAGNFTVTAPVDQEILIVGSNYDITWSRQGSAITDVKIEYSTNNGTSWTTITDAASNTGSYPWTVQDAISNSCKIRVSDPNNSEAYDDSEGNFKIKGSLTVTSPNDGTESWNVASTYPITWTKTGSIASVNIYYSANNGTSWTKLNTLAVDASLGTWDWAISGSTPLTTQGLIRVENAADSSVKDESDNNFIVKGSVTLVTPSATGISLRVGDAYAITWTKAGAVQNVELHFSTNGGIVGGGAYAGGDLIATVPATDGSYSWSVPDRIGTNVRVRVRDAANSAVWDESDNVFEIKGKVLVNAPNGTEEWYVGDPHQITWTPTGTFAQVRLQYSTNAFATEDYTVNIVTLAAGASGVPQNYDWTVPDAITNTMKVRVKDTTNDTVADVSDATFIVRGRLTLLVPNGTEEWVVGGSQNITWSRAGSVTPVKLEYSTNGGSTYPFTIVASTNGLTGTYPWSVPDAISDQVRVKITDVNDSLVTDESDANFFIKGYVVLQTPNGGEAWGVGTTQNITWARYGSAVSNVKLEYSDNGGTSYDTVIIASTDAATGSYPWQIPDHINATMKIKITSTTDSTITDTSNNNFKIVGVLTVQAPNGGEQWGVQTQHNISWTMSGSISNVKIDYSTNSGQAYPNPVVASTPAGSLAYLWTIPDAVSNAVRVRVADASDSTVFDTSNADFSIEARFDVTSPDGGEVWVVGSSHDITWTKIGSTPNVKIEYSTDSGLNFPNTIIDSTPNTGSYPWVVPDVISSSLRVRVSDANNTDAYNDSEANFKIRGNITVAAPNGNEAWIVGSKYNILWTKTGSIANVKLEYSTDGGGTYPSLILASIGAGVGTYEWTIPDDRSQTCRVKVTDTTDSSVFDTSNADFKIRGNLVVTAPNGSEQWAVESLHDITWTRTGSIPTVKLEYSIDGGSTYPNTIIASTDASAETYPWTIPDTISNLARVRVVDTTDSTVNDISNANFKIMGVLELTSPNAGTEAWEVGSSHPITWNRTGSIANVKLEYSIDGGSTFPYTIAASVAAAGGTYTWNPVPDNMTTQGRVRVSATTDASVNDVSAADFKIIGKLTVTAPDGGEVWPVGTTQSINWTRVGTLLTAVKIDYSLDGGVTYPNAIVATTAAATGNYPWSVPDAISSSVRVKVTNVDDTNVFDASDANFKIRGDLILSAPNGSEVWLINSNHSITWVKNGSIGNARLDYSTDGGATYPYNITTSVNAALQTLNWVIPDRPSIQVRVKIADAGDATVFDFSDANFTIRGGFTITAPNGGEKWPVGSSQSITWNTFGSIANVKIEYSKNNGTNWSVISNSETNLGTYGWTVPDAISTQCLVRIYDIGDPNAVDVSDAVFKIHGTLNVTAPNGGEQWGVGTAQDIIWTKSGSIANVKLEYSTDGGATFPNLIVNATPAAALTYPWTVPDSISANVKIRITDSTDTDASDVSDGAFKIKGAFLLTAPNGGEAWIVGTTHDIAWTTFGTVGYVKLEYSTNAGTDWNQIVASVANNGTYPWTVPDTISTTCRVRVSDANDSSAWDISNNNFKIRGNLTLTAPNGGEKWNVGSSQVIAWDRVGSIANVRLEYSDNGGATYVPIINQTPNAGTYAWTVPDAITTQARVRVTNYDDSTVTDASNANFKIQGTFVISSPNGGEAWIVGSSHDILWSTSGTINFADLAYSTDGGATYPNGIVTSLGNIGTYSWTVPDNVSGSVRVRVADSSDDEAFDVSNGNFRIRATVILTAPLGGETYKVGSTYNITWTTIGSIPNVKIEYSRFNFLTDINTIAAAAANSGSYPWTVPDRISNTVKVRVSDPNDAGANAVSGSDFRIITGLTVTAPNGGQMWDVGSSHDITWTCTSAQANVPDVKIEYSVDGGATYPYILAATPNDGVWTWDPVPDTISANVKVRVSDLADSTAYDASDSALKIRAKFTLEAPNGGEVWTVAESHDITWSTVGTVANVKLDYSLNDFGAAVPIIASTANDGAHTWTIPDSISTNVKVRVMSIGDTDAYDISDAAFKIRGDLRITAPNGGELWLINQNSAITWVTTGTIANVKLLYSMNSGATYPNTIVASTGNTNSYSWLIPDTATPSARVRIENTSDDTVYDTSDANFRIRGFFTLTSPNGGEEWVVSTAHNVTWVKGGTIGYKLLYSTDSGATYPNTIVTQADPAQNTGSYSWTIPDAISLTARVRIEDPNDAMTNDESDADFTIRGDFAVTAPNGGERWIALETRPITWATNAGTISDVKLEYSKDNFVSDVQTIIASTPNDGSYDWLVPDDRSASVRVRVSDVNDPRVYDVSNAAFTIDYYTITFELRDLLTNEALTNLSAVEKITGTENIVWQASGLTSPVVHEVPYGFYTTSFVATGYGEKALNYDFQDGKTDQAFTLYLETTTVHIWRAYSDFAYEPSTSTSSDALNVTSWLERDGFVVSGATDVTVEIYDGGTLIQTVSDNSPNAAGFFDMRWTPTTLQSGKAYGTITKITNASGAVFKTPGSFQVTEAQRLQDTQKAVEQMRDVTLPAFQTGISTLITDKMDTQENLITDKLDTQAVLITSKMETQTQLITTKMDQQQQIITDKTNLMVSTVNATLSSFETKSQEAIGKLQTGATKAVEAGENLEATAKRYSWKATVSPNPSLPGDLLTFSCQGPTRLTPVLSVYNYDNKAILIEKPMTEKETGLYVYDQLKADTGVFTPGKAYTYVITEPITGGLVSGSGTVESTSITAIAGLAAAAPEAERASKKVLEAVTTLQDVLVSDNAVNIGLALTNLQQSVEELPELLGKQMDKGSQAKLLNQVADRLKTLVGDSEGIDLQSMLEDALGENPTIKEIQSKTEAISGVIKFLSQLFEAKLGGMDTPVVSTSLAPGSVKFRIAVANPSSTRVQTVPVKVYLPAEVKPGDIMDLAGLTLEYDSQKSIYYVYSDGVELAPLESRLFEVEVEDIWFVDKNELASLRKQTEVALERLKNTDYFEAARLIGAQITERLDAIVKSETNDESMSRERHIGQYRTNTQEIVKIKEDLARI
ncbi:MAG: hypothetical protein ACM3L6_04830, partial [Deltaproteobacteria bacterium]